MTAQSPDLLRAALTAALGDAGRGARGLPATIEPMVRAWARARRLGGDPIERVIVDLKAIVREQASSDDLVFLPRLVGWTVAGYFAGSLSDEASEG